MTISRLGLAAFLGSPATGCFVARVWMVDYELHGSAFRDETSLSKGSAAEDLDLIVADEHVTFSFRIEPAPIRVSIENHGPGAVSLDCADASFIDASREAHRVLDLD